jgi:hypothetical protein
MARWLQPTGASRTAPRLWVECVWLLESRDPIAIVRTVNLRPGVNVVWAREPESQGGTGRASAGHGVGKTSFCLLLRYGLGDDAPSITALRDKAAAEFPKGGVVVKVHIEDTTWMVFRPYGAYGQPIAGRCADLDELFGGNLDGDFRAYSVALQSAFIGKLPAATLPGSNQPLEWRHLLAWCVRDQKTRFDGFFHWRDGDGLGFRRSKQDPPLFVRSVLGLLDAEADKLMRAVETTQAELTAIEASLPELEREPIYALGHVERQLRARLGADQDVPVLETTLGPSLESMVRDGIGIADREQEDWERQADQAEEALAPDLVRLSDLQYQADVRKTEQDVAQSLVDANEAEYTRLSEELQNLDRLAGQCKHGLVDFSDCEHIKLRRTTTSLPWRMSLIEARDTAPKRQAALQRAKALADAAQAALKAEARTVSDRRAAAKRLRVRSATSATRRDGLKSLWDDLLLRRVQRDQGVGTPELDRARQRQTSLRSKLDSEQAALARRNQQRSERAEALKSLTACVAARLLGEEGHARFVPDSNSRPFDLAQGGEAYQVLEVLLGDIVCLVDAASTSASSHPGFLVHDCPREADMSERLYQPFLAMTAELEEQLTSNGATPFQYIVTTTSAPPRELQGEPALVLELRPGSDDGLLFKRRLMPGLAGIEASQDLA